MTESEFDRIDNLLQIVKLAKEVRQAQKEYFKTRSKDILIKSKQLEKELDKLLEEK